MVSDNGTYDTTLNNEVVVNNEDYTDALVAFGVEDDLADGIEALTTYSNEVTGESDTTLSDAVRTLADGYGGGGGEYETGTYIPTTTGVPTIYFTNTHSTAPSLILFADVTETGETGTNKLTSWTYVDYNAILGSGIRQTPDTVYNAIFSGSRANTSDTITFQTNVYTQGDVTSSYFKTYMSGNNSYHSARAGRTYKWIAMWKSQQPSPTPSDLPAEYQGVAYIENTGSSYIDTGYSMTSDVTEQSIKFFSRPSGASALFGAERSSAYSGVMWTASNSVSSALFIGSTKNAITEALQLGIWHTLTIKTTSATSGSLIIDGYERAFTYSGGILKAYPIWLFNNNNAGTAQYAQNKIARFQIKDNGVKVRDLVPCYRKADNKPGMYDLVNDVFYTNAGTGEFSYGEIS